MKEIASLLGKFFLNATERVLPVKDFLSSTCRIDRLKSLNYNYINHKERFFSFKEIIRESSYHSYP